MPGDRAGYRLVGDVAFDEVAEVAGGDHAGSGGVGPDDATMLLRNTLEAARRLTDGAAAGQREPDARSPLVGAFAWSAGGPVRRGGGVTLAPRAARRIRIGSERARRRSPGGRVSSALGGG